MASTQVLPLWLLPQQRYCSVVHGLTSLLRAVGLYPVLDNGGQELFVQRVPGCPYGAASVRFLPSLRGPTLLVFLVAPLACCETRLN